MDTNGDDQWKLLLHQCSPIGHKHNVERGMMLFGDYRPCIENMLCRLVTNHSSLKQTQRQAAVGRSRNKSHGVIQYHGSKFSPHNAQNEFSSFPSFYLRKKKHTHTLN